MDGTDTATDSALFSTAMAGGGSAPPALPRVLSGSTAHKLSRRAAVITQRATASRGEGEDEDEARSCELLLLLVLVTAVKAEPLISAGTLCENE